MRPPRALRSLSALASGRGSSEFGVTGLPLLAALTLVAVLLASPQSPRAEEEIDRVTGLALDGDWQLVQANCTECHSALLITQNSGNRSVWRSRIVWMRETHGMDLLDAEVEDRILDYLTDHYGPRQSSRRAPLASHLLPENPYAPN